MDKKYIALLILLLLPKTESTGKKGITMTKITVIKTARGRIEWNWVTSQQRLRRSWLARNCNHQQICVQLLPVSLLLVLWILRRSNPVDWWAILLLLLLRSVLSVFFLLLVVVVLYIPVRSCEMLFLQFQNALEFLINIILLQLWFFFLC